ncbi:unnamed protein product, partial [Rotaria sordida]
MCIFYIIKKRADSKAKKTKQLTESKQLTIPRAHLPTIGAMNQGTIGSTDSSRAGNEKQANDASDTSYSVPRDPRNDLFETNDFGEIEFVTDMLDDMIKDDDNIEEDFIEAINPN